MAKGGKGKGEGELRQRVQVFVDERVTLGNVRIMALSEDLNKRYGVTPKMFRSFFGKTLTEYCQGKRTIQPGSVGKGDTGKDREKLTERAARFQSHLHPVEREKVAMVTFGDDDGIASFDRGPLVGTLEGMCSREEAKEREQTRQLDKLEWKKGSEAKNPEVNLCLATKKYQRSSADKAYKGSDVRTLAACRTTIEFLMTEILDFDIHPKLEHAVTKVPYIEVYSYLRDRTRSCRVDLHLQQPRSTTKRTFVETHECCLRFELLSLFLLMGGAGGSTEKYDPKLGLKAISQTIEPLLNAYQAVRDAQKAKSILAVCGLGLGLDEGDEDAEEADYVSPWEPALHRYIILLLMSFSPEGLLTHLSKLSREILRHPLVSFATQAFAAYQTDDYGLFLRCYRQADFLTAVAMNGLADLARLRALWLLARTYPQPVGDKLALCRLKTVLAFADDGHARDFLSFHGVKVVENTILLPKKGTSEATLCPLLNGPNKLPDKCDYPKGADSLLVAKFTALGLSRAHIVFGNADPIVEDAPIIGDANGDGPFFEDALSRGDVDVRDDALSTQGGLSEKRDPAVDAALGNA